MKAQKEVTSLVRLWREMRQRCVQPYQIFKRPGFLLMAVICLTNCNRDHDPGPHRAAIKAERLAANLAVPKLTAEGKIPGAGEAKATSGNPKFDSICSTCHGTNGKAETPAAQAMNPKPRNFSDATWQDSVDDAHIAKVIKEGGASVGLSPTMAAWGSMLNDAEITEIVKVIRAYKGT